MVVRSIRNQYLGINAHLHSLWQGQGGWSRFHSNHISDIMRLMRPPLMVMGYIADSEPSIQIRRVDDQGVDAEPESDISIYDLDSERAAAPRAPLATSGMAELTLPLREAVYGQPQSSKTYTAIKIYEVIESRIDPGKLVAWVELLSPSNKPGGRDARAYSDKRDKLLQAGIVVVELDYLHESSPTLYHVPDYRTRANRPGDPGAHAYRITIIEPRPDLENGSAHVKEFGVDVSIPVVSIPLNRDDVLEFDFGAPYRKTFEETLYGLERVDYAQLPLNLDRYLPDDQARIARRMLATCAAASRGDDLEVGPFAVDETITLEDALSQIENIRS